MRNHIAALLLSALALPAFAQTKGELDDRARKLMSQFETLQNNTEARIPAENLKKALGIIIMDRTKGGFIVGYEQGFGIAMVRNKGDWSPLAFVSSHEGSFGAQIGGKSTFCVMLLMTESARDWLMDPKVNFGGEATGTGGDSSAGTGESFTKEPPIRVYGESKGVYGGATIKGGSIATNDKANENYYGRFYSVKDILFDKKVQASDTATEFAKKLDSAANAK